jgi:hypothetical protein
LRKNASCRPSMESWSGSLRPHNSNVHLILLADTHATCQPLQASTVLGPSTFLVNQLNSNACVSYDTQVS